MAYFNPLNSDTWLQIIKVIKELQKTRKFPRIADIKFSKIILNDHIFTFDLINCTSRLPTTFS
jgi:hypothetical protein